MRANDYFLRPAESVVYDRIGVGPGAYGLFRPSLPPNAEIGAR
jgi:hypothetical protein